VRGPQEVDHYETLEISRDATLSEIDRAYRILREAYETESLALYSVFTPGDAEVMRDRIEEAYRVLSDSDLKTEYDAAGGVGKNLPPGVAAPAEDENIGPDLPPLGSRPNLDEEIGEPTDGRWDGDALRRARLYAGMELEEIADITKVGIRTLRQIEDEAFEDLPAAVYVRGFITTYARTIGIDPDRVVSAYIQRLEESRVDQGRGRFLGRR